MFGLSDVELCQPPSDSIAALEFSPSSAERTLLCAGSWDQTVRLWQVETDGTGIPKALQHAKSAVLDVSWCHDGTKIFFAGCDNQAHMWDLQANVQLRVGSHLKGVRTCHWIKADRYNCLMTGSWDKTLKFWDTRSPAPMTTISLPERCYCADVIYPMAVVGTACRSTIIYSLQHGPTEHWRPNSLLNQELRSIAIFKVMGQPSGCAVACIEGRVAIQNFNKKIFSDFRFKCHRSIGADGLHNIYAVNDVKFHPINNTLATAGSDGTYSFWDIETRTKFRMSRLMNQPLVKCCFSPDGQFFAYALSYDWSKGHEYNDQRSQPKILLHPYFDAK